MYCCVMENQGKVTVIVSDEFPDYAGVYELTAGSVNIAPGPSGSPSLKLYGYVDKVDPNVVLGEGEMLL